MCLAASAQTMRDVWMNMPDSVAPYLNKNLRTELADYVAMKADAKVRNLLGDTTRIEKMTNDYLLASLSPALKLELKLLDKHTLAVVKTWSGPVEDSQLLLCDAQWHSKQFAIPTALQTNADSVAADADPEGLRLLLNPYFVRFQLNEKENSITIDYTFPLLNNADTQRVNKVVRKRYFKWDGGEFVE